MNCMQEDSIHWGYVKVFTDMDFVYHQDICILGILMASISIALK